VLHIKLPGRRVPHLCGLCKGGSFFSLFLLLAHRARRLFINGLHLPVRVMFAIKRTLPLLLSDYSISRYIPLLFATACLSATSVERTIDLAVVFKLNGQVHFLSSKPKIPNGARAP
jgi:hypothetical protein